MILGRTKGKPVKSDNKTCKTEINISGSQKRKAPKETIVKRDITTSKNEEAQIINLPTIAAVPGSAAADLFTLAEVAVQTASIDKAIIN